MLKNRKPILFFLILCLLFAGATAGPLAAKDQKALFIYWRGETACGQGLKEGLKVLGMNVQIEEFDAEQNKEQLDTFLASLDESAYDFIYTFGTTVSVKTAGKVKNTPVLFGIVTNPVKAGLIESWEKPGKNVTGISHAISYGDQLDFIFQLGAYKKIGILYDPKAKNALIAVEELEKGLQGKGIPFVKAPAASEDEIPGAVSKLVKENVELVYLPSDSFVLAHADKIIPELNTHRIQTYGALEQLVKNGAMIGIVSSYEMVGKELAGMAADVLNGKKPADISSRILPINMQTVMVNGKTVEAVGANLPYELLSSATIIN